MSTTAGVRTGHKRSGAMFDIPSVVDSPLGRTETLSLSMVHEAPSTALISTPTSSFNIDFISSSPPPLPTPRDLRRSETCVFAVNRHSEWLLSTTRKLNYLINSVAANIAEGSVITVRPQKKSRFEEPTPAQQNVSSSSTTPTRQAFHGYSTAWHEESQVVRSSTTHRPLRRESAAWLGELQSSALTTTRCPLQRESTGWFESSATSSATRSALQRHPTVFLGAQATLSPQSNTPVIASTTCRSLQRQSTVWLGASETTAATASTTSAQVLARGPLTPGESTLNTTTPAPAVSAPTPTSAQPGSLLIPYENYRMINMPSGERSIYIEVNRWIGMALSEDEVAYIYVTPEILETAIRERGVVTSRFGKGLRLGMYIPATQYRVDRDEDNRVVVPLQSRFVAVGNDGAFEVVLFPGLFRATGPATLKRKQKVAELRKEFDYKDNASLADLEVVWEEERPVKRTRWYGPGIDINQVPKGQMKKDIEEHKKRKMSKDVGCGPKPVINTRTGLPRPSRARL